MNTENFGRQHVPANGRRSLDRLLLDEANHRVANEVAAALAAIRLASSARGRRSREQLLALAIDRLEGFGETSRLLAGSGAGPVDAGPLVDRICRATLSNRVGGGPTRVVLELARCHVPGEVARRTAMIAYELITNSRKHAFGDGNGELVVRLDELAGSIVLTVADDGPGLAAGGACSNAEPGARLGGRIVAEIVRASNGSVECDTGPHGTAVQVSLPTR